MADYPEDKKEHSPHIHSESTSVQDVDINTSGHVQELDRTFSFFSICALSLVADNAWGAGAGALVVAL